jgi:hypothetical protein
MVRQLLLHPWAVAVDIVMVMEVTEAEQSSWEQLGQSLSMAQSQPMVTRIKEKEAVVVLAEVFGLRQIH